MSNTGPLVSGLTLLRIRTLNVQTGSQSLSFCSRDWGHGGKET